MALFGKREIIFKTTGDKVRWKAAKAALKTAGIKIMEAGSHESEPPICSCGAKSAAGTSFTAVGPGTGGRAGVVWSTMGADP